MKNSCVSCSLLRLLGFEFILEVYLAIFDSLTNTGTIQSLTFVTVRNLFAQFFFKHLWLSQNNLFVSVFKSFVCTILCAAFKKMHVYIDFDAL